MAGWSLTASGESDDPEVHELIRHDIGTTLANPLFGTGSSEINGPFVSGQNFHLDAAQAADEAPPGTGEGDGDGPAADGPDGGQSGGE